MKLNYYLSTLTIINIVLTPLATFAEIKPESITKIDNQITQLSIENDFKKEKSSLVKKLIRSKQLNKQSQQENQNNIEISTSAAD